jgi:hypothetical protein
VAVKPTPCTRDPRQRRPGTLDRHPPARSVATRRGPTFVPPNHGDPPISRTTPTATLALGCSLAASAGADSIIRITDDFWSVNGRPIQRIGNLVLWDKGSAFITPQGAFGRNFDTIPGVIPRNPYGMFGELSFGNRGFGNPGFGDCSCTPAGTAGCRA